MRHEDKQPTAIATVCLSGTLSEKIGAIAAAGFEGVEIFDNDLLSFAGSPADVRRMIEDQGLRTVTLQPFRDFEGMPEPYRSKVFARAERKSDVMGELGCDLLMVCSNVSPNALGGIDRAAADFRELGQRAARRGMRVAAGARVPSAVVGRRAGRSSWGCETQRLERDDEKDRYDHPSHAERCHAITRSRPMTPTITAFERSPDRGRGLARDMRVRWALEEVRQHYDVRLVSFSEMKEPAHLALHPSRRLFCWVVRNHAESSGTTA